MSSSLVAQPIDTPILENPELSYFDNQISGHSCLLKCAEDSDHLFKPYDRNESNFYEFMSQNKNHPITKFIPEYFGTLQLPKQKIEEAAQNALQEDQTSTDSDGSNEGNSVEPQNNHNSNNNPSVASDSKEKWVKQLFQSRFNDNETRFVKLQDLTSDMDLPCMLDLKMGSIAYNPVKAAHQAKKLGKTTSSSLKFRVCGLQVKNTKVEHEFFRDKYWGRKLKKEYIHNALALFFFDGENVRRKLIKKLISILHDLSTALKTSYDHKFYSVSLLLIYDSTIDEQKLDDTEYIENVLPKKIKVRLIDFAHTVVNEVPEETDMDLVTGVENLINCLSNICEDLEVQPILN